jgi:hypothetical protein
MLNVTILQTLDDPRTVDKTFTTVAAALPCSPYEGCTVLNPRIILSYTSDISLANYMYILQLGRFYYIENVTLQPGGMCIVSGSVDVLRTYAQGIRNCTATVVRSESIGAPTMYPDDKLPIIPGKKSIISSVMPNSLHGSGWLNYHYILTIKGGDDLTPPTREQEEGEQDGSEQRVV